MFEEFKSETQRLNKVRDNKRKFDKFKGKVLLLGCGAVGKCTLRLLIYLFNIPLTSITVMDMDIEKKKNIDNSCFKRGLKFIHKELNKNNYLDILEREVKLVSGDLFIDLSYNVQTEVICEWCFKNNVLFVNTSIEDWDPYDDITKDPRTYTLYYRHMELRKCLVDWNKKYKTNPTIILDHGANPGLVSHFTKLALIDILNYFVKEKKINGEKEKELRGYLKEGKFNYLAKGLGLKTIHISERDSQITDKPKKVGEFVNTWSIEGLHEEAYAPSEIGWGTHEKNLPDKSFEHTTGPKNQIALASRGCLTLCKSFVPSGPILGYVIRHGEAFSISDRLTVWENEEKACKSVNDRNSCKALYRPTCHYVYCPCDGAVASIHEYIMNNFELQKNLRIMNDEIIDGKDELGCTLLGNLNNEPWIWFIGSLLDIHETRKIMQHESATTLQVAASIISAAMYAIENPNLGLVLPDDIDFEYILNKSLPFLGKFESRIVSLKEWDPYTEIDPMFNEMNKIQIKKEKDIIRDWQFKDLLVNPKFDNKK